MRLDHGSVGLVDYHEVLMILYEITPMGSRQPRTKEVKLADTRITLAVAPDGVGLEADLVAAAGFRQASKATDIIVTGLPPRRRHLTTPTPFVAACRPTSNRDDFYGVLA